MSFPNPICPNYKLNKWNLVTKLDPATIISPLDFSNTECESPIIMKEMFVCWMSNGERENETAPTPNCPS
jgi:hypothetical protein